MKIGLEIKNISRAAKPKKDDVIIFDGKEWYVTTKQDLFKEYEDKMDKKLEQFSQMIASNAEFKKDISNQMVDLGETIKKFIKAQGE